jgi:hypothetical protein
MGQVSFLIVGLAPPHYNTIQCILLPVLDKTHHKKKLKFFIIVKKGQRFLLDLERNCRLTAVRGVTVGSETSVGGVNSAIFDGSR